MSKESQRRRKRPPSPATVQPAAATLSSATAPSRAFAHWPAVLLLAYALLLGIATATLQRISPHSTSRLATMESLVARGTFAIDASTFSDTIDKVKIGPHFYSHQPPGHAVLTAILYWPLHHLGLRFSQGKNAAYVILTFLTNGLGTILALILFYRALAWFNPSQAQRLLLAAGVACGTLVLPYSTTFNVHGFVAAWLFVGFYCFLRGDMEEAPRRWLLFSGLAFSVCAALDHGTAFLYAAFCALLLVRRGRRREALWFLLPASVTLLPTAVYYYAIGGSFKPFAARPELFAYPGSPWTESDNPLREQLTAAGWNSPWFAVRYGFLCLFGPRGFLIYNPLIWVALYGMGLTIRSRLRFWQEAVTIAVGSAAMMLYYFFASTNYSGWSYSVRWFVAVLFLWGFFGAAAADRLTSRKWLAVPIAALAGVSMFYAVGGVADPWARPNLMGYLTPLYNINRMREPLPDLSLSFSPNFAKRGADGKWPLVLTLKETGGVPVTLTRLVVGGVDRSKNIVAAFGGNHLPANAATTIRLNLTGYIPPFDLVFEIEGEQDNGRAVKAEATVRLLP